MLKTVKKIHQSAQLKVAHKELHRSAHHAETDISNLLNIDPNPESGKLPKIELGLYQLEELE